MIMNDFIVGCGYVGKRLAQQLLEMGHQVYALSRSDSSTQKLSALGVIPLPGNLAEPETLPLFTHLPYTLFYFAPPPLYGTHDVHLNNFLDTLDAPYLPQKIILISTTGVYGDCQGAWVDETQSLSPQTDRARRRAHAEHIAQTWADKHQIPLVILRVAGIYGADQLPLQRLQQGFSVLAEAISPFSNRVHVVDLVRVCLAAAEKNVTGVFNVSDGNPTTMSDYFNQVARMFNLPLPPVIDRMTAHLQFSAEMLSYLGESRRIDNRKMREQLGIEPMYPDLVTGLLQCQERLQK